MSNQNSLQPPSPEVSELHGQEVQLHHQEIELPGGVLHDRQEASERWGINGDITAVITLPGEKGNVGNQFAIVDYGPIDDNNRPYGFHDGQSPITFLGHVSQRYGIIGMNLKPNELIVAYSPLTPGNMNLGRNTEHNNYLLGLAPSEDNVGNISRQHLSIQLEENGHIKIADHSSNGTKVEIPVTIGKNYAENQLPAGTLETNPNHFMESIPEGYRQAAQELLESGQWQKLSPNQKHESHIDPKQITAEMIRAVVTTLLSGGEPVDGAIDVGTLGKLEPSGEGESKKGFVFTDNSGKKMHVLVDQGYLLPPQISADPKVYMRSSGFSFKGHNEEYGAYSDARTYLSLPVQTTQGETLGVHFQEYAGVAVQGPLNGIKKAVAASRAKKYIQSNGLEMPHPEDFNKHDHYLLSPNGSVGVIDIDVIRKVSI